jgi:hypothetical protein
MIVRRVGSGAQELHPPFEGSSWRVVLKILDMTGPASVVPSSALPRCDNVSEVVPRFGELLGFAGEVAEGSEGFGRRQTLGL